MTTQEPVPLLTAEDMAVLSEVVRRAVGVKDYLTDSERETLYEKLQAGAEGRSTVQPAAAQGWRLVPVLLTTPMRDAIEKAVECRRFNAWPADVWEDALAAAPPAPTTKETPP